MRAHVEGHRTGRIGWLRAAVLGANDGIVSTASLVAGVAGLVAGALSMAAGEYVSVSSQSDTERADIARERKELATAPEAEHAELAGIYEKRGLDPDLAAQVARQLMERDALAAHAHDELGITETLRARPLQAAFASAASFAVGAFVPLAAVLLIPISGLVWGVMGTALVCLAALGWLAARTGGSPVVRGTARVVLWGALAMGLTAGVGALFGAAT
jgi:VIT1/CCC1 family predicted Fe2+/Mn2+ transporter